MNRRCHGKVYGLWERARDKPFRQDRLRLLVWDGGSTTRRPTCEEHEVWRSREYEKKKKAKKAPTGYAGGDLARVTHRIVRTQNAQSLQKTLFKTFTVFTIGEKEHSERKIQKIHGMRRRRG